MIQFSFSVESDWYIQIGSRFSAGFPPPFLQDIWDFNASKGNCTCDGCSIQVPWCFHSKTVGACPRPRHCILKDSSLFAIWHFTHERWVNNVLGRVFAFAQYVCLWLSALKSVTGWNSGCAQEQEIVKDPERNNVSDCVYECKIRPDCKGFQASLGLSVCGRNTWARVKLGYPKMVSFSFCHGLVLCSWHGRARLYTEEETSVPKTFRCRLFRTCPMPWLVGKHMPKSKISH